MVERIGLSIEFIMTGSMTCFLKYINQISKREQSKVQFILKTKSQKLVKVWEVFLKFLGISKIHVYYK